MNIQNHTSLSSSDIEILKTRFAQSQVFACCMKGDMSKLDETLHALFLETTSDKVLEIYLKFRSGKEMPIRTFFRSACQATGDTSTSVDRPRTLFTQSSHEIAPSQEVVIRARLFSQGKTHEFTPKLFYSSQPDDLVLSIDRVKNSWDLAIYQNEHFATDLTTESVIRENTTIYRNYGDTDLCPLDVVGLYKRTK